MGAYDSAPLQNGALSYEELVALERQTDALYQKEMLSGVYDERRRCFAITGGAKRYSITSTCFALLALDAEPERWHSAAAGRASARLDHLQVDAVLEAKTSGGSSQLLQVVVPAGVNPGDPLTVHGPGGQFTVTVPPDAKAGSSFQCSVPAAGANGQQGSPVRPGLTGAERRARADGLLLLGTAAASDGLLAASSPPLG